MPYILKIKRSIPITLDELIAATQYLENIRITETEWVIHSGPAGTQLRSPVAKGSIEILEGDKWQVAFNFRENEGCLSFRAPPTNDVNLPIWKSAATLTKMLAATIIGEESELYDPETMEIELFQYGGLTY